MASLISNHQSTATNPITNKKKKKRSSTTLFSNKEREGHTRWRSEKQQRMYAAKLVQALKHVRNTTSSPSAPRRSRAVREAADRALAVAARGRTLWSRAILTNRIKIKFRKQKRQRNANAASVVSTGSSSRSSSRKPRVSVLRLKGKNVPAVQRKVRVLGRLVPGCRKQPLPVILEEATDYIAALEMQVRAMSTLAELLSRHSSGAGSNSGSAPPPS